MNFTLDTFGRRNLSVKRSHIPSKHWTRMVQKHMEGHLMHVGGDRTENEVSWTGWRRQTLSARFSERLGYAYGESLKTGYTKNAFREEIDHRLNSEFRHCGTLGKEFYPLVSSKDILALCVDSDFGVGWERFMYSDGINATMRNVNSECVRDFNQTPQGGVPLR
jgi:hypothetical protein